MAPFQTLHLDVWGPSPICGPRQEHYFLIVVDDYSRYASVLPLRRKADVPTVLEPWQNGVVRYAAHQVNLWPSDERPRVMPVSFWTGSPGVAADYHVWGSLAHVRAPGANNLSPRIRAYIFLGFPLDTSGWQFYDPVTSLSSETFSPPLFLTTEPPPVASVVPSPSRPAPSEVQMWRVCVQGLLEPVVPARGFPPRSPLRPVAAEPGGVLVRGTGVPGGVVRGGSGSGGAGARDTGTTTPTPRIVHFLTRVQHLDRLERDKLERFERAKQQHQQQQHQLQQQSQSEHQERVEEESQPLQQVQLQPQQERVEELRLHQQVHLQPYQERVEESRPQQQVQWPPQQERVEELRPHQQERLEEEPHLEQEEQQQRQAPPQLTSEEAQQQRLAPARLVSGPLPSPPVPPVESLASSPWPRRSPFGCAVSLEPRRSRYCADGPFHLVLRSRAPPPPVLPQPPESQFELGFLAIAVPHLCAMLLAPEGDPDALDTSIPRTHAEVVSGPWASYWIAAEEAEMASYRSTGTYVDAIPPPGTNVVSGMWLYKPHRPVYDPLSVLVHFVARGRHRPSYWYAAKRVAKYVASTSCMGLVLGGKQPVTLTGFLDSSWADNSESLQSIQGYCFSLGTGAVSWRSTRASSVSSSSCEAEVYTAAMAAQELRWLSFFPPDLGERPRAPPVLFADKKSAILLCKEPRLVGKAKHIQLCYFLL
ncbi:unnamed protein product [Closterium sp. NIES-53]